MFILNKRNKNACSYARTWKPQCRFLPGSPSAGSYLEAPVQVLGGDGRGRHLGPVVVGVATVQAFVPREPVQLRPPPSLGSEEQQC